MTYIFKILCKKGLLLTARVSQPGIYNHTFLMQHGVCVCSSAGTHEERRFVIYPLYQTPQREEKHSGKGKKSFENHYQADPAVGRNLAANI